jgi:hypothetical protein
VDDSVGRVVGTGRLHVDLGPGPSAAAAPAALPCTDSLGAIVLVALAGLAAVIRFRLLGGWSLTVIGDCPIAGAGAFAAAAAATSAAPARRARCAILTALGLLGFLIDVVRGSA